MSSRTIVLAALGLLVGVTPAAGAQNLERSIERMADRLSLVAERTADRVSRAVERALAENGWDDDDRDGRVPKIEEKIDTTFAFSKDGVVDLSNISGDIVVTGWSRGEARVRAYTERGRFRTNMSSSRLTIETESVRGRIGDTRIDVSIPQGVRVILRSTSGDLTSRDTRGPVETNTTSGDIIVDKAVGRVTAEDVSGDIQIGDVEGDVEANSVSGEVQLEHARGAVRVETTSGEITLSDIRSTDVYASSVSGEVSFSGSVEGNGRYEFHSHSGEVSLELPRSVSARFSIETYTGDIDSDFPMTLQPGERTNRRPRRFEFSVGSGEAHVIAESFSGGVRLSQTGVSR
ncbi:MAG: DUF4097 family beta strand repeat-containing protein [Gemmatimonadaceae bacterium]